MADRRVRGKSLYFGYGPVNGGSAPDPGRTRDTRARVVSFDRPFGDDGLPRQWEIDHDFISWAERAGYDLTYATSIDLHAGRVDPSRYGALVFSGHDEYWSSAMRDTVATGVRNGTSLAFMASNNMYWHVRLQPSARGRADRQLVCYRTAADPAPGTDAATMRWRDPAPGPHDPEQSLLGIGYNGIVGREAPLVVRAADHWLWRGCGVRDGDRIDGLVGGEADGFDPRTAAPPGVRPTLLAASPYRSRAGDELVQNTSVYETAGGAVVFVAGTFNWTRALGRPGFQDARVQTATSNLFHRILRVS